MLRDSQGALGDFKAAIKLSPHTAHMYFNRGNLYASMEQFDQAEKDYSKGTAQIKICNPSITLPHFTINTSKLMY